jgi:hypothetical protein
MFQVHVQARLCFADGMAYLEFMETLARWQRHSIKVSSSTSDEDDRDEYPVNVTTQVDTDPS